MSDPAASAGGLPGAVGPGGPGDASHQLKQSMIDGGLWSFGGRIAAVAGAFLLNLALARSLTPADYGVYFVVMTTMVILATVGTAGMDLVVVRFAATCNAAGDRAGVRSVVARCLVIVLGMTALVCALFYLLIPWFFGQVVKMPVAIALSGTMLLWLLVSTLQRQLAETFRGLNDIRCATLFGGFRNNGILISLLTCIGAVLLWASGTMTLAHAFAMTVCASLLVVVIAAWTLMRRMRAGTVPPAAAAALPWPTLFHEGWPLCLVVLISVLRSQSGAWFAAAYDVAEQVALFAIAQRFVQLLTAPLTVVNALLPPLVADLYARGQTKRLERIVQAIGGLASLPCLAILAVILLFGQPLLGLLFGAHYQDAYAMLVIMCIGQIALIVTGSWQIVLPMTGHRHQALRVSMSAAAVHVVASLVGGYYAGVLGVAIGTSVGMLAGNIFGLLSVRRHVGIWTFVSIRSTVLREATTLLTRRISGLMSARSQP
jgi:O-antigen/teichoic acid export membrane protein